MQFFTGACIMKLYVARERESCVSIKHSSDALVIHGSFNSIVFVNIGAGLRITHSCTVTSDTGYRLLILQLVSPSRSFQLLAGIGVKEIKRGREQDNVRRLVKLDHTMMLILDWKNRGRQTGPWRTEDIVTRCAGRCRM